MLRASTVPPAAATTCLTIASPRPVPREARAASARQKRSKRRGRSASATPGAVVDRSERRHAVVLDREPERGAVTRVADRVLDQVLGDDAQHPRTQRQVDVRVTARLEPNAGARGGVLVLGEHLFQHRQRVRVAERDDLLAALELGEEEDLVDQRPGVLDLGPGLVDQRVHVGAREGRRVEQRQDPREWRSQLVGDRGCEAGAQLVEGRRDLA